MVPWFNCGATLTGPDQGCCLCRAHRTLACRHCCALLVENQAVVRRLLRGLTGSVKGDAALFWHQLLDRWRPASRVAWIPSHGKQPDWAPPLDFPDAATCRRANAFADAEVSRLLAALRVPVQQCDCWHAARYQLGQVVSHRTACCHFALLGSLQDRLEFLRLLA